MRRAAAATACAIALGGCAEDDSGGPLSKAEYEERFREIARESEEAAPDSPPATTPQQQAEQIDTGLDRLREVADKLAELEPPPDIARAHAVFVAGLRATADDAEKLVRVLRAGDERRAEAMLDNGTLFESAAARKVGRARHEFSEKGYNLGGVSDFP